MVSIPKHPPEIFVAGDTVLWTVNLSDYSPVDGWLLAYTWSSAAGVFMADGVDNAAGGWDVTLIAADTINIGPDLYRYQATVTLGPERHTVDQGETRVEQDYATSAPVDSRSYNRRLLDAIEATLAGRADTDQASYSYGGVSLSRLTMADLQAARDKQSAMVQREDNAERIRNGQGTSSIISVVL